MPYESAILVEEALTYERKGGLVYITDPVSGVRRAMELHTFFASFHNAAACMQECHRGADVVPFPAKGEATG